MSALGADKKATREVAASPALFPIKAGEFGPHLPRPTKLGRMVKGIVFFA